MIFEHDDLPEAIEPDPPMHARWAEHQGHVFKSDPRNALRTKVYDAFGRWLYEDTGTTYNLSEAQYAKLTNPQGELQCV